MRRLKPELGCCTTEKYVQVGSIWFSICYALRSKPLSVRYRQHTITVHVELCVDSLFLAEFRQNMNFGPFYVFLRCAVDEYSDVSEKRTPTETLQKSPTTAHSKIPTDDKLNNKTRTVTKSKCPQISLQFPIINVTL